MKRRYQILLVLILLTVILIVACEERDRGGRIDLQGDDDNVGDDDAGDDTSDDDAADDDTGDDDAADDDTGDDDTGDDDTGDDDTGDDDTGDDDTGDDDTGDDDDDYFVRFRADDVIVVLDDLQNDTGFPDPTEMGPGLYTSCTWQNPAGTVWFSIGLPRTVTEGGIYTEENFDIGAHIAYHVADTNYPADPISGYTISVTTWEGPGGDAAGGFDGTVIDFGSGTKIEITEGEFSAPIETEKAPSQ